MTRGKDSRREGESFFDGRFFDPCRFLRLLAERQASLLYLTRFDGEAFEADLKLMGMETAANRLFWLDVPYAEKTLGGAVGEVVIRSRLWPPDLLKLLWFGQYLHVGKNTAFGFGEYRLLPALRPYIPARNQKFVDLMLEDSNVREAISHLV